MRSVTMGMVVIEVKYKTDSGLFNLGRLQAVTKVKETVISDYAFADDCAPNASTEQKMQHKMGCLSRACDNLGLTISSKKTDVMYQPAPAMPYQEPHITVKRQELLAVDNFTYLGSTLSRALNIDAELNNRISKTSAALADFVKMFGRGLGVPTKMKVHREKVVLTTFLYACETWTVYSRHAKQLNHFHLRCLRRLLHITWQDKIPDTEDLQWAGIPSVYTLLQKAQARWAAMSSECQTVGCQNSCCTENCVGASAQLGGRRNASKCPSQTLTSI
ncbi:uncharacterized protein LOC129707301 [Leucoraja erinacea]|uniref:uncharacterized protein LOC129707301 n=1 Tax=Leucoraja erinaceus TaxID=7782 RepID=UPI0024585DFC|nr:uncharacterized protein LOC129707301 [Leucoraja erinacea]